MPPTVEGAAWIEAYRAKCAGQQAESLEIREVAAAAGAAIAAAAAREVAGRNPWTLARSAAAPPRRGGGLHRGGLPEVLWCVGSLLDRARFGLGVADCAVLAAVSRDCRDAVQANACWAEALAALESDFPFVPPDYNQEDGGGSSEGSSEGGSISEGSCERGGTWRQPLRDPRYDAAPWEAGRPPSPTRRFGQLLGFAQRTVRVLRQFPAAADREWWHVTYQDSDFDPGQGLTLVHFSAQSEPYVTQNTPFEPARNTTPTPRHLLNTRNIAPKQTLTAPPIPQKALTLS
jgi:hypothetical protein